MLIIEAFKDKMMPKLKVGKNYFFQDTLINLLFNGQEVQEPFLYVRNYALFYVVHAWVCCSGT